jgi:hypothetical protein|tara:strand:- start:1474 stop:1905 length:432 start_codon:yes stop_codon:yes gene_type:complete
MAIDTALPTTFKVEILKGVHNFTASSGNTFKMALYTSSASLGATTAAYTTSNEVSGTNYTAKGNTLTSVTPVASSTTAVCDFADTTWSNATITARGAMIFNESASGDPAVAILNFGADKTSTAGNFVVSFPTADASNAIIRIA